jgi:hypothetical protein
MLIALNKLAAVGSMSFPFEVLKFTYMSFVFINITIQKLLSFIVDQQTV